MALCLPAPLFAQGMELPAYAYDAFANIGYAHTASTECNGAKINKRNLDKAAASVMQQMLADGIDVNAAVQHLGTPEGMAYMQDRESAMRARHGVAPEGIQDLCRAIAAEAKANRELRKMVTIR